MKRTTAQASSELDRSPAAMVAPAAAPMTRVFGFVLATQRSVARFDLRQPVWERTACELAGRQLTRQEWGRYLPTSSFDPACPITGSDGDERSAYGGRP